jgi:hypothetical protein
MKKNKLFQTSNTPNLKSFMLKTLKWNYEIVKIRKPIESVCGLTSKTKDNKDILCLDYDLVDKTVVLMDMMMLKDLIKPSLVFLFTTYETEDEYGIMGNYHVLILDKFYFREVQNIMSLTHADIIHRKLADRSRYRTYVIRISKKGNRDIPKLLGVWNFNGKKETSLAHYLLLKTLYRFDININNVNFDKFTETTLTYYKSASKLNIEDIKK